ncbi:MAG: CBS and ACT domain-containing protein [Thermodesulfobacteriota bacterium]|nr:CBS and ACT domain-containing protein [Thermodesulfobacteriota bacterium]
MIVKKWMSRPVISIESDASLLEASKLFRQKIISMLPVMNKGKLSGVVTDGDIKKASPSEATTLDIYELMHMVGKIKIKTIMSTPVVTVSSDCTVDEAARIMLSKDISGMPVVDQKSNMVGIITKSDVFRCLVSFTGVAHKGQIFAFRIQDRPGIIKHLTEIIRNRNGRLSSILTSYDDVDKGFRKVFIYVFGIKPTEFNSLVVELNDAAKLLYAADQTQDMRRIY